jgi:predicted acylesterase/phospholipase RssA
MAEPRRAITLGGGGPAAGLHIGVLEAFANAGITFDVWSLSCIGAWVGVVYNQSKKESEKQKVEETYEFFRNGVFRDDEGYKRFPINTVFGPDWRSSIDAWNKFVRDPDSYKDFEWQPYKLFDFFQQSMSIVADHMPTKEQPSFRKIDEGDVNRWLLNQVMAPNPFIRYVTSLMYLSKFNGLSRINYPDSDFMKKINFDRLKDAKPFVFHNAWDLDNHELSFFANRETKLLDKTDEGVKKCYKGPITAESLCACSALPFIEETVEIDGTTYCEGALVDTVNFEGLLDLEVREKPIEELWISRIVDAKQIRKPENLHDALANLCQLFAASVGEDDVKLFKYHVKCDEPRKWTGIVVEIHVPGHINFKWNHSNLDHGRKLGRHAARQAIARYEEKKGEKKPGEPLFINQRPEKDERWQKVRKEYLDMMEAAE